MDLPVASRTAARLRIVDEAVSTNDSLAELVAAGREPDFSVVATLSQTGGRGRLGRTWIAPPGKTLAASVLLRPVLATGVPLAIDSYGWLPLIAGTAMTMSIATLVGGERTTLKWPNDVLIDGRKVCGILAELLPSANGVIVGSGVNLTLETDELPVPTATSLALAGIDARGDALVDAVLGGYLAELKDLLARFLAAGDAQGSGIAQMVSQACSTIGREVRVELPGGGDLLGVATGIDESGRLLVRANDGIQAVAAGDVTHLRYE